VKSSPNDKKLDRIKINEPLLFIEGMFQVVRIFSGSTPIGIFLLADLSNSAWNVQKRIVCSIYRSLPTKSTWVLGITRNFA